MKKSLLASTLALLATACFREPNPATETIVSAEAPTAQAIESPATEVENCRFCARPSTVRECDVANGVATTLHWHLPELSGQAIGIFVSDENGADQPFAEQPADAGSIQTGPWLRPGLRFRLKSQTGEQLEEITITGVGC
ncbi:hypothetical protein [Luteimonas sp. e5]